MRIQSIAVKKLFGIFDHTIPLQSAERVTIIHGPNGFGKTAILKMIAGLLQGKKQIFEHTPFDEFSITLDDGTSRIIQRRVIEDENKRTPQVTLQFLIRDASGNIAAPSSPLIPPAEIPRPILVRVDRDVPIPYRLVGSNWLDDTGRSFSLSAILEKFPDAAESLPNKYHPGLIFDISQDLEVFFVETNRLAFEIKMSERARLLEVPHRGSQQPRVTHYSEDIVQRIRTVLTDYARHSQERDRTFPERLVRFVRDEYRVLSARDILALMAELEKKRQRLITLGLLDRESGLVDLSEEDVRRAPEALTIYVGDIAEKLKVFDDMARRTGALIDIINARFKYKHLDINREQGFRVVTDSGQRIDLEDLSSGEQHELIVLYELLFRGPQNGLILVDEPEISLHVAWQSRFLSDLISILEPTDAYAIVATHSPVIIGARSDLMVELKGPETSVESLENARTR